MEEMRSLTASASNPPSSIPRKPVGSGDSHSQKSPNTQQDWPDDAGDDDLLRSEEDEANSKHQPQIERHIYIPMWTTDILSLCLAAVSFAAIVITLAIHQDRPLPEWPHLISINTLIAIFTAILKASLIMPVADGINQLKWLWFRQPRTLGDLERFDSASRGPWGSIWLLFTLRGRNLAALGALITVVAMAIDPFSQQIIQYYDCSVPILGAISTIPVTNFYSAGSTYTNGGGSVPDGAMTAALYLGLLNPPTNASSSITFDCPTGNCTFAASDGASYSSLALCSRCSDISHTIRNASTVEQGPNYTLPSGCVIGSNAVVLSSITDLPDVLPNLMPADIFSFESLMFGPAAAPLAIRCSLFPCVNTYGGNITNGILREQRISSDPLLTVDAGQESYFSLITNKSVENGEWYDCSPTEHATDENTIPISRFITPYNFSMAIDPPKGYYRRSCVWTLAPPPSMGLMAALSFLFNNQTVSNIDDIPGGDQWMVNLYNNGSASLASFEKTMEGLVSSITTIIRQQGDNSTSGLASGTMSGLQTCIRVQWSWLTLPASLLLLTVVFLVATMMRMSFRYVRHIWKSSALALLFHGFSTDTLQKYGPVGSSDKEEKARRMRARVRFTDGEWKFIRSDTES